MVAPPTSPPGALGPIQLIPPGLMGLMQLKQAGRLPTWLSETVAPVVDLSDWYKAARRLDNISLFGVPAIQTAALATGANGVQNFTVGANPPSVPNGQIWWVDQLVIKCSLVATTDLLRGQPILMGPQGNNAASWQALGPDVSNQTAIPRAQWFSMRADRPFWAFPGDIFGLFLFDLSSTAGIVFSLQMRATPMPI